MNIKEMLIPCSVKFFFEDWQFVEFLLFETTESAGNYFCYFLFKQQNITKEGNAIFSTFITC